MANDSEAVARLLDALGDETLSAATLAARLQCSQPTVSRWVRAAGGRVLRTGRAQLTRYSVIREVGIGQPIPVTRIDESGSPQSAGLFYAIGVASGSRTVWMHGSSHAFHVGLPWFVADMRPQGFLGRTFPTRVSELGLPPSIADWNDNHVMRALCTAGVDEPGNLILGHSALEQFLNLRAPVPIEERDKPRVYRELAARALAAGVFHSSAGGEQPKFTTYAQIPGSAAHVIVKFSPVGDNAVAQRWRDLLRAEHHALSTLTEHGIAAARSRLLGCEQVYLEVERFDRVGARGRLGVVSLDVLDDVYVGERHGWIPTTVQLCKEGLMDEDDTRRVALLQSFGRLIHNTDMHFGNCALFHNGPEDTRVRLAPIYDMLPMRFAPTRQGLQDDKVPLITPDTAQLHVWPEALVLARAYWDRILEDHEISPTFHAIARAAQAQV